MTWQVCTQTKPGVLVDWPAGCAVLQRELEKWRNRPTRTSWCSIKRNVKSCTWRRITQNRLEAGKWFFQQTEGPNRYQVDCEPEGPRWTCCRLILFWAGLLDWTSSTTILYRYILSSTILWFCHLRNSFASTVGSGKVVQFCSTNRTNSGCSEDRCGRVKSQDK